MPDKADELKIGDTVQVNSGAPAMHIVHKGTIRKDHIYCEWFDTDGNKQRDSFHKATLKKVDPS